MTFNIQPDYKSLKVFGCLCFPCQRSYNTHKLSFRSCPCAFLGYANNVKGYKCLDSKGRIFISGHIVFNENVFPFNEKEIKTTQKIYNSKFSIPPLPHNQEMYVENQPSDSKSQLIVPNIASGHESSKSPTSPYYTTHQNISHQSVDQQMGDQAQTSSSQSKSEDRLTHQPSAPTKTGHHMITRAKSGIFKPKIYAANLDTEEPYIYQQAMQSEKWRSAVDE